MTNKKLAFNISLVYVILATIYCYCEATNLISEGILHNIFFPAIVFPSLILFAESNPWLMILICQIITLLIIWLIIWFCLNFCRKDFNKQNNITKK